MWKKITSPDDISNLKEGAALVKYPNLEGALPMDSFDEVADEAHTKTYIYSKDDAEIKHGPAAADEEVNTETDGPLVGKDHVYFPAVSDTIESILSGYYWFEL